MDDVKVNKLCETDFCIKSAHYLFKRFQFNIPERSRINGSGISGKPRILKEKVFWTTDESSTWQPLNNGIRTSVKRLKKQPVKQIPMMETQKRGTNNGSPFFDDD